MTLFLPVSPTVRAITEGLTVDGSVMRYRTHSAVNPAEHRQRA